jgi:hypothetical protein
MFCINWQTSAAHFLQPGLIELVKRLGTYLPPVTQRTESNIRMYFVAAATTVGA